MFEIEYLSNQIEVWIKGTSNGLCTIYKDISFSFWDSEVIILYDLCSLIQLAEEYFNKSKDQIDYSQFTDVDIFYNNELGEYLWSVCDHYDFEYWIKSFKTEKEAIDFCTENNYTIKSTIS